MSKKSFQHTFRGHVRNVNPRNEMHGETEVLAVDLSLRVMLDDGDEWDEMVVDLVGPTVGDPDNIKDLLVLLKKLEFTKVYDNHICTLSTEEEVITTLRNCKLVKFMLTGNDTGFTFTVQANVDGPQVGVLSELLGQGVLVDISGEQIEMATMSEPAEDSVEV